MKRIITTLLLITLFSCKVKKEFNKEQNQSLNQYSQQMESISRDSLWHWSTTNSILLKNENQWGHTQIKPTGSFTYSIAGGFIGEAEQIRILYQTETQSAKIDSQKLIIQQGKESKGKQEIKNHQEQNTLALHKKTDKKPISIWYWIGVGGLIVFGRIVYSKL